MDNNKHLEYNFKKDSVKDRENENLKTGPQMI